MRAGALVIVLALSATPVAGIVCGLKCESQAFAMPAHQVECHTHASGSAGPSVLAVHPCDHDVTFASYVTPSHARQTLSASLIVVPLTSATSEDLPAVAAIRGGSPPGCQAPPTVDRPTILRI